jgi:hypothetical protein
VTLLLHGCEDRPNPGLPADSTPSGGGDDSEYEEFDIVGTFTFSLSADPEAILADEDARGVIEDASIQTIADSAHVGEEDVAIDSLRVVSTTGGRRLAGENAIKVDYTITVEDESKAAAANHTLSNMTKSAFTTKLDSAITAKVGLLAQDQQASLESRIGRFENLVVETLAVLEFRKIDDGNRPCNSECKRCKRRCTELQLPRLRHFCRERTHHGHLIHRATSSMPSFLCRHRLVLHDRHCWL